MYWTDGSGKIEIDFPDNVVNKCSHQGDCYNDCQEIQQDLKLNLNRQLMIDCLDEYGTWDDLNDISNVELEIRIIWIMAGDLVDEINE